MADKLTPERRSANMSRIRAKDTKPEMLVRRLVHSMGYRYRLHRKDLPGKPDLVFPSRRKIIQVHGCFWHGHEAENCLDGRRPKSNTSYWNPKIDRNKERDAKNEHALREAGWNVMIVWECETKHPDTLAHRLREFLRQDEIQDI